MNFYSLKAKISDPNTKTTTLGGDEVNRVYPRVRWDNREYIYDNRLITPQKMIDPSILDENYFFECITTHRNPEFGHDWVLLDIFFNYGGGGFLGFICNEKVKEVLEGFTLPEHQFLKTRLFYQGEYLEYMIFQYMHQYPRSTIAEQNRMVYKENLSKIYHTQFNTTKLLGRYSMIEYKKHLEATMLIELENYKDLFYDHVTLGITISPRMKEALENANVTGVDIKLLEHVTFQFADKPDSLDVLEY